MSSNDGTSGTMIPGDTARAMVEVYDRRIAKLEQGITELEGKNEALAKAGADAAGDAVVSHKAYDRLEEEVKRLNQVIRGWENQSACVTTDHRHELAEYRATVTKLGHRLGCLKKRRKRESAELQRLQMCPETAAVHCSYCRKLLGRGGTFARHHWCICPQHPARIELKRLTAKLFFSERLAAARLAEIKRLVSGHREDNHDKPHSP